MSDKTNENPEPVEQAAPPRPLLTKFELCRELLCRPIHIQNEMLKGLDCHFKHDDQLQSRPDFLGDCFRALSDRGLLPALEAEVTKRGLIFPKAAAPAAIEQALEYDRICEEHDCLLNDDGTCPYCRDAQGKPFVLDMQSYHLKKRAAIEQARPQTPELRDPTPQELDSPRFNAVWKAIKGWDIRRTPSAGYAGATGTDVCTILDALAAAAEPAPERTPQFVVDEEEAKGTWRRVGVFLTGENFTLRSNSNRVRIALAVPEPAAQQESAICDWCHDYCSGTCERRPEFKCARQAAPSREKFLQ